jgi:hypothetical protein
LKTFHNVEIEQGKEIAIDQNAKGSDMGEGQPELSVTCTV